MRVCVVGTGYVGLVSAACLAELGHGVTCVDLDPGKVAMINRGESPIHEAGLSEILARNVGRRLSATNVLRDAFLGAELTLICVGTPFDGVKTDNSQVLGVAGELGSLLRERSDYCVIAVKSTVVPGTTDGPVRDMLESGSGKRVGPDFGLGMNPEFLAEGVAVRDFMYPDRIVVGGNDDRATRCIVALYETFENVPVLKSDAKTAETIKFASNALLATLISFSNELARYCEAVGDVDVADVMQGVHLMKHLSIQGEGGEPRLASATSFLWPGCGFGGSCFPKDVRSLISDAADHGMEAELLRAVVRVNDSQPLRIVELLRAGMPSLRGARVAVLGLAFKPGTDDVRESPSLRVVAALVEEGASLVCHDPWAVDNARSALSSAGVDLSAVEFGTDLASATAGAQAVVLLTSWPEYQQLPVLLGGHSQTPLFVDGRRLLREASTPRYRGVGLRRTAGAGRCHEQQDVPAGIGIAGAGRW